MSDPSTKKADVSIMAGDNIDNNSILIHLKVKRQNGEKPPFVEYITVGRNTKLEISVTNKTDHKIESLTTGFFISCPNGVVRRGNIIISDLEVNENLSKLLNDFFIPEVPGSHQISILHKKQYRFISSPGLAGSKYRITSSEQHSLPFSFDVYSENDLITFRKTKRQEKTSSVMLWVTICLLVITLLSSKEELRSFFVSLIHYFESILNWIKSSLNW